MSDFNSSPEFEEKIRKAASAPNARPEFVDKLRNELAGRPVKMKPRFTIRPAWAIAFILVLAVLAVSLPGIAAALEKLFGYVPGVGLVENPTGMRVLSEPTSVTRDGVTLTVTQALVYPDHVQLIYEVSGIAPENDSTTFSFAELNKADDKNFCGPSSSSNGYLSDGDAQLRLPNGTVIERVFGTDKYPENIFAMKPVYEVVIPADVTELTMLLKCIPWARLGAVPENWEVPLKLEYAPAGTVIGDPVLEVTPSGTSSATANGLTVSLDKVAPQDDFYSFYVSIVPEEKKDSVLAYYPASAYLVDASKQKTWLVYNQPFSGSHDVGEPWELQTVSKPAYGPYTMVMEKVFVYHQETGEVFFEFDPGPDPQVGQTWTIDQVLHLSGTDVRVVSATRVEKDLEVWGLSANTQGFEFTFEAVDGRTPFRLDIMDRDQNHTMEGMIVPISSGDGLNGDGQPAKKFVAALYYEKGIPQGKIPVAVNGQTTMIDGNWQIEWTSPDQTGVTLLDSTQTIPSAQSAAGATASLEKVVKLDDGYLFYIDMNMLEPGRDFRVIVPGSVFVIDSTGKKVSLQLHGPQVFGAKDENLWEYGTSEQIAAGPLKVVIEQAKAYYNPWDISQPPTKEVLAPYSFTFDAGAAPQMGQTWDLGVDFEMGGYKGKVISVRAVPVDSSQLPFPDLQPDRSIDSGYEFIIQSADPALQWNVAVSIERAEDSADAGFVDCIGYIPGAVEPLTTHTVTCRGLPVQLLTATIYEVSVQMDDTWEMDWVLPVK